MDFEIKNEYLEVKFQEKGAEITELKDKKGIQYIWTADKRYWARHAPVLFPIVGKLKDNRYFYNGSEYSMTQHGFARDYNFKVITHNKENIIFELCSNSETLKKYPFDFSLKIEYTLEKNRLTTKYTVESPEKIYFSIGAHPGFNCPLSENECFEDYFIEFGEKENFEFMLLDHETGLFTGEIKKSAEKFGVLNLNHKLFENDALVFTGMKSKEVTIKNKKEDKNIKVNFDGFPFLGIWTMTNDAPFICIEPWFGHADFKDSDNIFENKKGLIKLEKNEKFSCSFFFEIF